MHFTGPPRDGGRAGIARLGPPRDESVETEREMRRVKVAGNLSLWRIRENRLRPIRIASSPERQAPRRITAPKVSGPTSATLG